VNIAVDPKKLFKHLPQNLAEILHEGLGVLDADEYFVFVNQGFCDILGYSRKELIGKSIFDILSEEDVPKLQRETSRRRKGRSSKYEIRLRHKRGRILDIKVSASPLIDERGAYAGAVGLILDVTKQKQVEARLEAQSRRLQDLVKQRTAKLALANEKLQHEVKGRKAVETTLRRSEKKYRSLFDNMLEGVFQTAPNGDILSANPALVKMLGYRSEKELCNRFKAQDLYVDPKQREEAVRLLEQEGQLWHKEVILRRKNGDVIWVAETSRAVHGETGDISHYEGILIDISERKAAEEALRDSEEKFRNLVERAKDGITIVQNGLLVYVNPCLSGMLDIPISRLTGASFAQFIHPDDIALVKDRYRRRMSGEDVASIYQISLLHRTGRPLVVELNAEVVTYGGQPADLVIVRDITARRHLEQDRLQLQARIQHAQKLESLGVLAGGIAHDFNNLLMGILGNASLASKYTAEPQQIRRFIEKIETSAQRAAELTNQLLAYSGKGKFVVQAVNLSDVVREMGELLRVTIPKKVTLRTDLEDDLPAIEADISQMRQIIMNLIVNASEAIGEVTGRVTIRTGTTDVDRAYLAQTYLNEDLPEGRYVFLEVSDSGSGMEEETLQKIFDPFFTTKFKGRGLGLAAVLGIVRGHGGAIKVYSEPGEGSAVKVVFPVRPVEGPPSKKKTTHRKIRLEGKTALVVDDEDAVRDVAEQMLRRIGMRVVAAADGRQGVEAYRRHRKEISVVLLDTTMPEMNGEEVFRALRRLQPDVKVVLTSGYNEQEATSRFVGKGLAGFIQKPYTLEDLTRTIQELFKS